MRKRKQPAMSKDVDRLYKAIEHYVNQHGGNLIVIGGIEIQEWPGDVTGKFKVAINCLGKKPTFCAPDAREGR